MPFVLVWTGENVENEDDTDRESFEQRVILLIPLLVSKCLFWKEFTLIIRSAECPNFEVANPIKPALTSRETTLMVSILEFGSGSQV